MSDMYGLIELVLIFGLVLGVLVWQLISVRRAIRRDREAGRLSSGRDEPTR